MKGFILAAGIGQRLRPITQEVPKPLLPVGNISLIGYAIRMLRHHGIVDIIINTHHLAAAIEQALGDGAALGVKIEYSREQELLGTGGALKRMHEALDDTFVVVNSDIVIDVDLAAVLAHHQKHQAMATMVLRPSPDKARASIEVDGSGRICRLFGHGAPIAAAQGPLVARMYTGVQILQPRFLEFLPEGIETCVVRYGYAKALANQAMLHSYLCEGLWTDAGTPADYLAINALAIRRGFCLPWADPVQGYALAPRKEVTDAVRLGHDVLLGNQTHIAPPVVVGDKARLGDKTRVGPNVVLGHGVQLGKEAEISHSVVLDGVRVAAGSKLERCIVAKTHRLQAPQACPHGDAE